MSGPSKTLYVNNLNDKVKKPELRHQLYQLFAPFGRVVDIVALKTQKMRGQAFIVFKDQVAATTALRTLGGEVFYGKPLKITYAQKPSKALLAPGSSAVDAAAGKVVTSNAQREADDLKRSREEEDSLTRDREDKRARGEETMVNGGQLLAAGSGAEGGGQQQQQPPAGDDDDDMEMEMDEDDE